MTQSNSLRVAFGGLLTMAAALGIGRFVYTPILPFMLDALRWNKADAGLVASANFLGYLLGALLAGRSFVATTPRRWLLGALVVSAGTTFGTGLLTDNFAIAIARRLGGVASAFVIVCASTLVLDRLSDAGRADLAAVHFAGVGTGVCFSSAVVALAAAFGADWRTLSWLCLRPH
jgi:MFS family permease